VVEGLSQVRQYRFASVMRYIQKLDPASSAASGVRLNLFAVPVPSNHFLGREEQLDKLNTFFSAPAQDSAQRIATVIAKGGTGKTQLVSKLMSRPEFNTRQVYVRKAWQHC